MIGAIEGDKENSKENNRNDAIAAQLLEITQGTYIQPYDRSSCNVSGSSSSSSSRNSTYSNSRCRRNNKSSKEISYDNRYCDVNWIPSLQHIRINAFLSPCHTYTDKHTLLIVSYDITSHIVSNLILSHHYHIIPFEILYHHLTTLLPQSPSYNLKCYLIILITIY